MHDEFSPNEFALDEELEPGMDADEPADEDLEDDDLEDPAAEEEEGL